MVSSLGLLAIFCRYVVVTPHPVLAFRQGQIRRGDRGACSHRRL